MADHPDVARALAIARAQVAARQPSLARAVGRNLDAYPVSGAHYSAPGAREAWQQYNVPPVMYQRSPYATGAYRTFVDPFGQMTIQPLVGFPSRYPHVLSGVPTNPFYGFGMAAQLGPLTWPMQYPANAPFMQRPAAPAPQRRQAAPRPRARTLSPQPATPPAAQPKGQWVHYGDLRARADAMPVSAANRAMMNADSAPVAQPVIPPVFSTNPTLRKTPPVSDAEQSWLQKLFERQPAGSYPTNPYGMYGRGIR